MRFRSPEYVALQKQTESAYPLVMKVPRESVPPQGEGEMFLDFVLRFLTAYGFDQASEPISDMRRSSVDPRLPLVAGQKNDSTSELDKQSSMIDLEPTERIGNRSDKKNTRRRYPSVA